MAGQPLIVCENLSKRFGDVVAVENASLAINEGEFFALLGPSGCGKTTLLRMLAGLEVPTSGRALIDGHDMTGVPPNRRPVNMVFQSYALFPHMTVADNVGYGLKVSGVAESERRRRVFDVLDLVQLAGYGARKPDELSGGQKQRVALARALVKHPRVLLLDEPLSALDAKLREQMRFELAQLQKKIGITFIFVTHDQDEALALADRCAVMNHGRLEQIGTPADLYERPNSCFVADFIGSVNLFEGVLGVAGAQSIVQSPELETSLQANHTVDAASGSKVWIALRPEKIAMEHDKGEALPIRNAARGVIRQTSYLGSESVYEVELTCGRLIKIVRYNPLQGGPGFASGDRVRLSWGPEAPVLLLS